MVAGEGAVISASDRYSRQVLFAPIGVEGQEKIRRATVAIVGCGALGSFQAETLARAGIGALRIIDRDYVDFSNLQRQWLYDESDADAEIPKAVAAQRRLHQVNRDVRIEPYVADLTPSTAEDLLAHCDLILDGTDNFETRYLLNDFSVKTEVPWIYGAAIGSYGLVMPVIPGRGPCFACLYPEPPSVLQPTCDVAGVIAPATATVAALQVAAGLRSLCGWDEFQSYIQTFDVWQGTLRRISSGERDPECTVCAKHQFRWLDGMRQSPVSLCGRNAVQLHDRTRRLDLNELAGRLQPFGDVRQNEFALRLAMPKYEITFFPDGRAIVKGTTDPSVARSVYARLIGA